MDADRFADTMVNNVGQVSIRLSLGMWGMRREALHRVPLACYCSPFKSDEALVLGIGRDETAMVVAFDRNLLLAYLAPLSRMQNYGEQSDLARDMEFLARLRQI